MTNKMTVEQRGFVLIVVLWFLILLSGIALGISATVRTDTHLTRNLLEQARAQQIAQAGIRHAVLLLLDPQKIDSIRTDGSSVETVEVLGTSVRIRIVDECAKVDINTGWGHLITGLVDTVVDGEAAVALGHAILDWRDPDNRRRLKGAEDDDYIYAGRPYGARDGLFEAVEELKLLRGVDPLLYRRLEPLVTVDCLNAGIEPLVASPAVLAAVPGLDPGAVAAFLESRRQMSGVAAESLIHTLGGRGKYLESSPQVAFNVTVTAELPSGIQVSWRAIVWLTGDANRPFLFRSWQKVPTDTAGIAVNGADVNSS